MSTHSDQTKACIQQIVNKVLPGASAIVVAIAPKKGCDSVVYIQGSTEQVLDIFDDVSECIAEGLSQKACDPLGRHED
jgi:hypothetical protein